MLPPVFMHSALIILGLVIRANAGVPVQRALALENVLAQKAEKWNTSFSVGIYSANHAWTATAGLNDRKHRTPMEPNLRFPVGSVTKPFTCALVMQAREKGLIDIDAPISKYVDGILYKQNKTSMLELWNNDTNVSKITARRLMGMRAGLHEYNDSWYHEITLDQPHHDVSPFEILHRMEKAWVAEPGMTWSYASTGYELLGLALTAVYGLDSWEDFDQMSLFGDLRSEYTGMSFPGKGLCSQDPLIIHQYANSPYKWGEKHKFTNYTFTDIINTSCLNGWVCGNIASTPLDIARFHFDLQNGNLVSNESLRMMNDFWNWSHTDGSRSNHLYGFGLYPTNTKGIGNADPHNLTYTIGHEGADYGSTAQAIIGYDVPLRFGIALAAGSYLPMNCSMPANQVSLSLMDNDIVCPVYDEAIQLVTNGTAPRLNCSRSGERRPSACELLLPQLGCNATVGTPACMPCLNSTAARAKIAKAGCTSKYILKRFCGKAQCLPMLNLSCGGLVGQQACMGCAANVSHSAAKQYHVSCNASTMTGFCGPTAVAACDAALQRLCGARRNNITCLGCLANKTHARELSDAGCVSVQEQEFCDSPSLCNTSLSHYCNARAGNCSACVLKHRRDKACVGENSARTARGFCASCDAFLDLKCAAAKAGGNQTKCLKCVKSPTIKSELIYSGCAAFAGQSYCGVPVPPAPGPAKPPNCNWDF